MNGYIDTSDFLNLFSIPSEFKFLTHDIQASGLDLLDYTYSCQEKLLDWKGRIPDDLFELVRGFLFGPQWKDYRGDVHDTFCSSEKWVGCFLESGNHPMKDPRFATDVDAFKHSIRFRSGQLEKYFIELKERFPKLDISLPRSLKGADFYTDTRHLRQALEEIFSSMNEFADEYPEVIVNFDDVDDRENIPNTPQLQLHKGYSRAVLSIEQVGSFPKHDLQRDKAKLNAGGGTLANILASLDGYADWTIISRWADSPVPYRWNLSDDRWRSTPLAYSGSSRGFRHIITIYYKNEQ